ncbi:glycoside hydrolase superfamily [Cyathus striatus]|nr:glycoside hydrolase superfamily [Cyathus striatus]
MQQLIPSVQSFIPSNDTISFLVTPDIQIFVNSSLATIGSPSLLQFAETFKQDVTEILGFEVGSVKATPIFPSSANPFIFLSLGSTTPHKYYSGVPSPEGYDFEVTKSSYVIRGSSPIGVWWGTRTLLQQIVLAKSSHPIALQTGSGSDVPGWEVRAWRSTPFVLYLNLYSDLCKYASFFKIQSLHLHASDNLWNPSFLYGKDWRKLYSAFRFQPASGSPITGLVPLRNESWSQEDHGIDIVPEIDTPGHSLVITKWKPELMINGAPDQLNLSVPDTIPTIKTIWMRYFRGSTPGGIIGADEYDASLADDYISFVNEMSTYILGKSGKAIRIWGTREPSKTLSVSKNITIQHWDFPGDTIPVQLLQQGYKVINSEQAFLYLDGKTSDGGQRKGWAPNIFSQTDPSNNTSPHDPNLIGSIMALWNDWGNNATTPLEIYYQLSRSLAVFGEKSWTGSGVRNNELTRESFDRVQNLNRAVQTSDHDIVYDYPGVLKLPQRTSFDSVGPPYTLTRLLFSGKDSRLHLHSLAFEDTSTHILYPLTNLTLPSDKFSYMKVANMSFAAPSFEIGGEGFSGQIRNVSLRLDS